MRRFDISAISYYEGAIVGGRPHGFGAWLDGAANGEVLSGW